MTINIIRFEDKLMHHGVNNDNMFTNGEFGVAQNFLKRDDIIFDVGANKGAWVRMALTVNIFKLILCFEPILEACHVLQSHIFFREYMKIYNGVVVDRVGQATFHLYKNNHQIAEMSNLFGRPNIEKQQGIVSEDIVVNSTTIDVACAGEGVERLNFLKIDTEGAELLVLKGSKTMLENRAINHIQFEYGGCFQNSGATLKEIYEMLTGHDFAIYRIIPEGLLEIPKWDNRLENYLHSNYFAILQPKKRKKHKAKMVDK